MRSIRKRGIVLLCGMALFVSGCSGRAEEETPTPMPVQEADGQQPGGITAESDKREVTTTKLVTYDGPELLGSSSKLRASVNGEELFVYETRVNHNRIFSYTAPETTNPVVIFDFEGRVNVEVEIAGAAALSDVTVRPLMMGVEPKVEGNKISFELSYPGSYVLEYNDGTVDDAGDNALHLFTNLPEEEMITAENVPENTLYIGPGVYKADAIPVQSNMTVYLAGGAYVYGQIRAEQVENLTICGRGILAGSVYDRTKASEKTIPIELRSSKNLAIRDITILDPAGWTVALYKCDGVEIENLHLISARANGDGISVQSCSNVTMRGGFVRTWDDSLVVKNEDGGTTKNIVFDGVTVWTDLAQSCEVGYETNGAAMEDITFRNITIVHNYHKAAISIHNSDNAAISGVTYQNITIEDAKMLGDNRNDGDNDYLIDFTVAYSPEWSVSGVRGSIRNVLVENVKVLQCEDTIVSRMLGESAASGISDITIRNVEIEGSTKNSAQELALATNDFVSGVEVTAGGTVFGASRNLPYTLVLADAQVAHTKVASPAQGGLEVPEFSIMDVQESYMGKKISTDNAVVTATHSTGTTLKAAYDDGSGSSEREAGKTAYLTDSDKSTVFVSKPYTGEEEEFFALTFDFGEKISPGVVRVYLPEDCTFVRQYRVAVFVKREADAANFSRALSSTDFMVSPAGGNYFDIKLSSTLECCQLQLRIYRTDGMLGIAELEIPEIAFYPSSLSTNMPIVDSTEYNDVYVPEYLTDGNEGTYWEAKDVNAYFVLDMGKEWQVSIITLHLPPVLTWEPREQTIEILGSMDGVNFTTVAAAADYLFDPQTGNRNSIVLDAPVSMRYIKLAWSSNSSLGGYGAQLSEIYVYGE